MNPRPFLIVATIFYAACAVSLHPPFLFNEAQLPPVAWEAFFAFVALACAVAAWRPTRRSLLVSGAVVVVAAASRCVGVAFGTGTGIPAYVWAWAGFLQLVIWGRLLETTADG